MPKPQDDKTASQTMPNPKADKVSHVQSTPSPDSGEDIVTPPIASSTLPPWQGNIIALPASLKTLLIIGNFHIETQSKL